MEKFETQVEVDMKKCVSVDQVKGVPIVCKTEVDDHDDIPIGTIIEIKPEEEMPEAIPIEVKIEGQGSQIHYWQKGDQQSDTDLNDHLEVKPFIGKSYSEISEIKLEQSETNLVDQKQAQIEGRGSGMSDTNGPSEEEFSMTSDSLGAKFAKEGYSVSHTKKEGKGVNILTCNVCGKTYTSKKRSVMIAHVRTHTGEKPFVCKECGRAFGWPWTLARHMVIHGAEKRFACSVCGDRFVHKSALNIHTRKHIDDQPASCVVREKQCAKKVPSKSPASRTGKSCVCDTCGKVCSNPANLKAHMKNMHTGDRSYPCNCGESFLEKSDLTKHLRTHRKEEGPFPCEICGKLFDNRQYVMRHKKIHTFLTKDTNYNRVEKETFLPELNRLLNHNYKEAA